MPSYKFMNDMKMAGFYDELGNYTKGIEDYLPSTQYQTSEHKNKVVEGFSSRYNLNKLLYFEVYDDEVTAISREKQLKRYNRAWKDDLISKINPSWRDLYEDICK